MTKQEVEIYSEAVNAAVVRTPGRRFPGVIVQGDTLANLSGLAEAVAAECASEEAKELAGLLDGFREHYERVMSEHGLDLPYHRAPGSA